MRERRFRHAYEPPLTARARRCCGSPPPSASPRRTSPTSRAASSAATGRRSPTTRRCGAGRTTSARRSGARSGTTPGVVGSAASARSSTATRMPGARWFPDARLNFAENLLARRARRRRRRCAGVPRRGQARAPRVARGARRDDVARGRGAEGAGNRGRRSRRGLPAQHARGDRRDAGRDEPRRDLVVVLARFRRAGRARPLRPDRAARALRRRRLLVQRQGAADSRQGGRDRRRGCRRVERVVVVPYLERRGRAAGPLAHPRRRSRWDAFLGAHAGAPIEYARLPFDHPLYILYSSGTTGVPKCIVHGAGRHAAAAPQGASAARRPQAGRSAVLLHDLRLDDVELARVRPRRRARRCCSTTGRRSSTAARCCGISPKPSGCTHFGTSAKYIDHAKKIGVVPRKDFALAHLRTLFSTGSPLAPESFDYVYQCVKDDLCLSSIAGGTDIVSCFALGCPTLPVWRGELQCRGLGMRGRRLRRRRQADRAGTKSRASSSARRRFRRCRSGSGTIPATRSTAPRTSSAFPASGATATTSS